MEFDWRPLIVTTHWRYYEEALDWDLASLIDPELEIIRTKAVPTKPLRVIGDIGIRSLPWHLSALRRLRAQKKFDFLLITVPSFYSAILGQLLWRDKPLPFGVDYIDPWVHVWPDAEIKYSKAWVSMKLGASLEPWAIRNASLISAVASSYFQGVLDRNPQLQRGTVTAAMPYGFSTGDFTAPAVAGKVPTMFDPDDGRFHLVYAGALLPKAHVVLERLLEGLTILNARSPKFASKLRLHFIGTGKAPNDRAGFNVRPIALRFGLDDQIKEHPHRMGYLDVLAHLTKAHGILIVGSTEPHYTPSKVYQSVQARRPILALLHEESAAVEVLQKSRAGYAIKLTETRLPTALEMANALEQFVTRPYQPDAVDWRAFDAFSARESARTLAAAMDRAFERWVVREPYWARRGSGSEHPT